jgi:outer membrane protein insertion porin family
LSHSAVKKEIGANYTNPYYTEDGVSRSLNFSATRYNPGEENITDAYTTDEYSLGVTYSIPVSDSHGVFDRIQLGYGYQNTMLDLTSNNSLQVDQFVTKHGRHFQQLSLMAGWTRDSRDQAIFPTRGNKQSISGSIYLPLTNRSLYYYKLRYSTIYYHPIAHGFIFTTHGKLAGGNGFGNTHELPLFRNFYAGGMGSVRGYSGKSLGPIDSRGDAVGGNFLMEGSVGLILPNVISENLRTTIFFDGGNVFNTHNSVRNGGAAFSKLRYSTGVQINWLSPMGIVLNFSAAKALHKQHGDDEQRYDFSLGTNFG